MIEWIDIEKQGQPTESIDFVLVMHGDDYEFGRYDGKDWLIYVDDFSGDWRFVHKPIHYYARLNRPD